MLFYFKYFKDVSGEFVNLSRLFWQSSTSCCILQASWVATARVGPTGGHRFYDTHDAISGML